MTLTASQRIGEYVRELTAKHLASPSDFRVLPQVIEVWRQCVGDSLAREVRPVSYRQGRLLLHVTSAAWRARILQQRASIATHLRAHAPLAGLRELQIKVAFEQTPLRAPGVRPARLQRSAVRCLGDLAEQVEDAGLRAALQRLAARGEGA